MDLKKLRDEANELLAQARAILDLAEKEKRDLTQEETNQYDAYMEEFSQKKETIARVERQQEAERWANASQSEPIKPDPNDSPSGTAEERQAEKDVELRAAFERFLRGGLGTLSEPEYRALQADVDASGGYTVPPEQFVADLIKAVDDQLFIRGLSNTMTLTRAESLGVPSLDADPADADWTVELGTGSADSTMAFGKRELTPHPLAKRIKISNKLLRASALPIESLVRDRLAYKFAVTEEKAFLTGSGSGQPLGVFTASSDGISTGRDVSTGNTTTAIGADNVIECKYTLKSQYHARAVWIFHRDAVKMLAKLKDGDGRYLWESSMRAGEPDRLRGFPVRMSEYAPNTFTSGLYVGILGDFSKYWIVDALSMQVQRLVELYAETNEVGFIGRLECDAMPVLEEAFVRVTLST